MNVQQRSTPGEEIANSISHGLGLVAAVLALPILTASALERGETVEVVGAFVFAITMILLYLASTLYHAFPAGPAKRVFRVIDHSAIYLFIAGSYTPFTLGVLRGDLGWALLGAVWNPRIGGRRVEDDGHPCPPGLVDRSLSGDGVAGPARHQATRRPDAG